MPSLFFPDLHIIQPKLFQDLGLRLPHLRFLFRLAMVMPEQVQHAMYHQQLHFGFERVPGLFGTFARIGDRDEDIAQVRRTSFRVKC